VNDTSQALLALPAPGVDVLDPEFVPIEDAAVRSPDSGVSQSSPASSPDPCPLTPGFSPDQDRDHESLVDAVSCSVRRRILMALTSSPAQRLNVTELARRVGVPQDRVTHHLGILKNKGLVYDHQAGRFTEYECAPGLVRLEQREDGRLCLTLSRGNGVEVTLTAPGVVKARVATDGVRPAVPG
jgi:DNA-binding transcriptional ArsR family regulator